MFVVVMQHQDHDITLMDQAVLNLPLLKLYVKGLAAKSAFRLRETYLCKPNTYGHSRNPNDITKDKGTKKLNWLHGLFDYMVEQLNLDSVVNTRILSSENWDKNTEVSNQVTNPRHKKYSYNTLILLSHEKE